MTRIPASGPDMPFSKIFPLNRAPDR